MSEQCRGSPRAHADLEEKMTDKKLEANQRNALKSTGPKTRLGKAVSSRNALKHGMLAAAPILSGIESRKNWNQHRDAWVESIAPVGYLEEVLAIRSAVQLWRMWRTVRYESDVSTDSVGKVETDLEERDERGSGKPEEPETATREARIWSLVIEMLEALPKLPDDESLDAVVAANTMWALWGELPESIERIQIPGVPELDEEFDAFDHWTAGILRKFAEGYADAGGMTTEALVQETIESAYKDFDKAKKKERYLVEQGRHWRLLVGRESRRRTLLEPDVLEKVARYESNLERSFFRTLHEIQRLQASRTGVVVPPPASVEVDLTVDP